MSLWSRGYGWRGAGDKVNEFIWGAVLGKAKSTLMKRLDFITWAIEKH